MTAPVHVRALTPVDAAIFRLLRIEALEAEPAAFSADLDEERALDLAAFEGRLSRPAPSATFGAFADGSLVGIASLLVETGAKQRHRGLVVGVYLSGRVRGRGAASHLLGTLIDHAAEHLDVLELAVGTGNAPARALYMRLGFEPYGLRRDALRVGGKSIDEDVMALDLRARRLASRPRSD